MPVSWEQMAIQVLADGRPADIHAVANGWETLLRNLRQVETALTQDVDGVADTWKGPAADAFHAHMERIIGNLSGLIIDLEQGAGMVYPLRAVADALATAQQNMPVPAAANAEILAARNGSVSVSAGLFTVKLEPSFYELAPVDAAAALNDFIDDHTGEARKVYNALNNDVATQTALMPAAIEPPAGVTVDPTVIPPPETTGPTNTPGSVPDTGTAAEPPQDQAGSAGPGRRTPGTLDAGAGFDPGSTPDPHPSGTSLAGAGSTTPTTMPPATSVPQPTAAGSGGSTGGPGTGTLPTGGIAASRRPPGGGALGRPVTPATPANRQQQRPRTAPGARTTAGKGASPLPATGVPRAGREENRNGHRSTWLREDDEVWTATPAAEAQMLGVAPPPDTESPTRETPQQQDETEKEPEPSQDDAATAAKEAPSETRPARVDPDAVAWRGEKDEAGQSQYVYERHERWL